MLLKWDYGSMVLSKLVWSHGERFNNTALDVLFCNCYLLIYTAVPIFSIDIGV